MRSPEARTASHIAGRSYASDRHLNPEEATPNPKMRRPGDRTCADRFVDQVAFDRNPSIEVPRRPERRGRLAVAEHRFRSRARRQGVSERETSQYQTFTSHRQLKRAEPALKERPHRSRDAGRIGRTGNHPRAAHVPTSREEWLQISAGTSLAAPIVAEAYDFGRK